jgi:molecular chaperone DnaK
MDGRKRRELRDALMQAGINIVQFVHEPLAALYAHFRQASTATGRYIDHAGELALVFDWGGGTLDLTLCQLGRNSLAQIANLGDNEVGGDYVDEAILRYVIEEHMRKHGLEHGSDINPGARAKLLEQCEKAKMRLSERKTALIYVPDYFDLDGDRRDIECNLKREQLDDIAGLFVRRGLDTITGLLGRLNLDQRRIALCLATGGMINMPSIRSALLQIFGADRLHISSRGDRIISEGCAWIAHDQARLTLAKPIEVVEARQSYLPVFREGDRLPIEGEVVAEDLIMYCVDPRDGKAKFQLVRPRHLGKKAASDARDTYTNLTVRVEPGSKPFFERIDLRFTIDDNLIVAVEASSSLINDSARDEIYELEFSLDTGNLVAAAGSGDKSGEYDVYRVEEALPEGSVCARSNVTKRNNRPDLVPGELLYQIDRHRFDLRHPEPLPQLSQDEHLFYQPCSSCRRRYNDPACNCASRLRH